MQQNLLFGIVGLLIGSAIGFFAANSINRQTDSNQTAQPGAIPENQQNLSGAVLPDVAEMIQKAADEPQNFALQMRTGDMYAQIGRFDHAVEFYKKGVLLKPDDFNANVVLANALFDSGKFVEAEGYYAKALTQNEKDVNVRTDLGTTFVERPSPDYERAIKEFNAALELEPKHEPTLYYLGVAYARKGDIENAKKALNELEKAKPGSELIGRLKQNIEAK